VLSNALPNVLPALIGQFRGRVLQILSGAVVVEVVLGIPGVGELLWDGTLLQDFFVVLAAAWAFSLFSGLLLMLQGVGEVLIELYVRRAPRGVL
jgi:ABC-type dipeptide/oligopeptide/nickel transport system permease component